MSNTLIRIVELLYEMSYQVAARLRSFQFNIVTTAKLDVCIDGLG